MTFGVLSVLVRAGLMTAQGAADALESVALCQECMKAVHVRVCAICGKKLCDNCTGDDRYCYDCIMGDYTYLDDGHDIDKGGK